MSKRLSLLFAMCALAVSARAAGSPPSFTVDANWPKPLPGALGEVSGQAVDDDNHVWIIHRGSSVGVSMPPILEFDEDGNLLQGWGGTAGPGYTWPATEHGLYVDHAGNVWTAGDGDQILKFTHDGRLLLAIGEPNVQGNNADTTHLNSPADIVVDDATNEAFVADGYGNHRVIVFDATTGAFKRMWGAYGGQPSDVDYGPRGYGYPVVGPTHCIDIASDGLVYVCDRDHYRIQVFRTDGTFVKELFVRDPLAVDVPSTLGTDPASAAGLCTPQCAPAFDVAFSPDPAQTFLYVAVSYSIAPANSWQTTVFGQKENVFILERATGKLLGRFGARGTQPGAFTGLHGLTIDGNGDIYTAEITGQRVQKFSPSA